MKTKTHSENEALRADVIKWSSEYAMKIEAQVNSGEFKPESKPSSSNALKMDKKELNVWKLSEAVAKPDFSHWLDSIDNQLDAVHGFEYPDLVFAKIKRLPTEVTAASLAQIIVDINEEHAASSAASPPGLRDTGMAGGADPWWKSSLRWSWWMTMLLWW